MCEIKYEKIPPPAGRATRSIPLNAAVNERELSWQCLTFALGQSEHRQLTARIDGIDRAFLVWNVRLPCSRPGCSPSPSHLGATRVSGGLALLHTNYSDVYLCFETILAPSSTCPDTLPPGWGRWDADPLLRSTTGEYLFRSSRHQFY